jgi:transposase
MMIVPAGVKVHLALGYTDMRKGMDGLAALVQEQQKRGPFICVGRDYVAASPSGA